MKKYFILALLLVGSASYADVYKYVNQDGEALLTSVKPTLKKDVASKPTTQDIVPDDKRFQDYKYVSASKSVKTKEKVTTGPTQVYKLKMCRAGNDVLVPCYQYAKTLPSQTYTVEDSKSVPVSDAKVLDEAIHNHQAAQVDSIQ